MKPDAVTHDEAMQQGVATNIEARMTTTEKPVQKSSSCSRPGWLSTRSRVLSSVQNKAGLIDSDLPLLESLHSHIVSFRCARKQAPTISVASEGIEAGIL